MVICVLAAEIFDILEDELPADFKRRYGLSWNLLKASLGRTPGKDMVKVKLRTIIIISSNISFAVSMPCKENYAIYSKYPDVIETVTIN